MAWWLIKHRDKSTFHMTTPIVTEVKICIWLQARFQQKQMQEKEQKLLRLYESQTQRAFQRVGRGSAGSSSSSVSSSSSTLGAGKVRQLFQERRQQNGVKTAASGPTGWDRSYPLEPLEGATKRLHASKSTGNLKAVRGTSLERNYSNSNTTSSHYQDRNQTRRSRSQVRGNSYVAAELGGSFRQQQLYDYPDNVDTIDYPQNHQPRHYRDEQNNRIRLEREQRESEFFHTHRIYDKYGDEDFDIENEDPPFEQLDYDDAEDFSNSSHVFQKLPNVGGRLLMEAKANNNVNVDRYKTYSATNSRIRANSRNMSDRDDGGRRPTPPVVKEPLQRRREPQDAAPVAKPKTTVAPKKPDVSRDVPVLLFVINP